ncbi:hypothetical protein RQP46_006313 [Phenoliferia psychrophenolica]
MSRGARALARGYSSRRRYPPWPRSYPTPPPPPLPLFDNLLREILNANGEYADAFSKRDPQLLAQLAQGQSPKIFWLGCSDSRVSAELSTGVAPGSIFVHRNVGNTFHPNDTSALAAMYYAVHVLKVESIVVCGHTGCGGVRAAMEAAALEQEQGFKQVPVTEGDKLIANWIAPIKTLAETQLAGNSPEVARYAEFKKDPFSPHALNTLTERHVAETVRLVAASSIVRDAWEQGSKLDVHGWMYNVATARLHDLRIGVSGVGIPVKQS